MAENPSSTVAVPRGGTVPTLGVFPYVLMALTGVSGFLIGRSGESLPDALSGVRTITFRDGLSEFKEPIALDITRPSQVVIELEVTPESGGPPQVALVPLVNGTYCDSVPPRRTEQRFLVAPGVYHVFPYLREGNSVPEATVRVAASVIE
jgi:hypothetical protein